MSKIISRRVMPRGTSTRPVRLTLPTRAKVLVPLLFSVPYWANHSAPFCRIRATQASVSTLLMMVGLPHRPATAGKGGRGRGMPRCPSIEAISAVSSPQTKAPAPFLDLDVEIEPRAQDVLAQQAALARPAPMRHPQPLQRQRILGAAVDVAQAGPDGVAGDQHALQQRMGIALQQRAVHERAGIALVGVADQVLRLPGGLAAELPLPPGGKTGAAAAPQARPLDLVDDLLRARLAAP